MKNILLLILGLAIAGCQPRVKETTSPFHAVSPDFENRTVIIPEGFTYTVLFQEGDTLLSSQGLLAPAKGSQDMLIYIPINQSSEHGYLYVNHEEHKPNSVLGDGGGGSILEVKKINGTWQTVGDIYAIDFSTVGETFRNCGGTITSNGHILTTEEEFPMSNEEIMSRFGITDTSDYNGRKKYLNYGWVVEVDPITRKAIRKIANFGRFPHEDLHVMPDNKTVYITSDNRPSLLFKFIAEHENDFTSGQLFAFQQTSAKQAGKWLPFPMELDSLSNATDVAVRMGATMYVSHEWIELVDDKLYITESGASNFNFSKEINQGGIVAKHLTKLPHEGDTYHDHFGRILSLDLKTNQMEVVLEGGVSSKDSMLCFSSPDAMTAIKIKGKNYLVISEDSHSGTNGKATEAVKAKGETYNEIYFLDLSIVNPTLDDLQRFMMAPEGCETTGNFFTPDGKTMFTTIQHPSSKNPAPFNKTSVIAITGF